MSEKLQKRIRPGERIVRVHEGRRKDGTKFYALMFEGPNHRPIMTVPSQLKTILAMQSEAKELLQQMPAAEPPLKTEMWPPKGVHKLGD